MAEIDHPYQRLQVQLANLIASTAPETRLPSEPVLAQQMGVSRATLREAMRAFEGQGLIRRKQGLGTFVVGRTQIIESGLEVLESIETLAQRIGLEVSMGDLHVTQIPAKAELAEALGTQEETQLIHVSRVINANNRPVAYLIDILPEDVLSPEDLGTEFTGSVLDFLLQRGEIQLTSSRTEIRAIAAPADLAKALQIQRGDVLLQFVAYLYSISGQVIDYSMSYFLPGYFKFHVVRKVGNPVGNPWINPEMDRKVHLENG